MKTRVLRLCVPGAVLALLAWWLPRWTLLPVTTVLNVTATCASRLAVRELLERRWRAGIGLKRILIAGAGDLGRLVADRMLQHRELGYQVVGFIDDRAGGDHIGYRGLPLLGTIAQAPEIAAHEKIDDVYVALPIDTPDTAAEYDNIRWYLMHENIHVFVEDGDWYIAFMTRCKNLRDDNLCGIYDDHRITIEGETSLATTSPTDSSNRIMPSGTRRDLTMARPWMLSANASRSGSSQRRVPCPIRRALHE